MNDRTCSVPGCEKPHAKVEWCEMHYWRQHRTGSLEGPVRPIDKRPLLDRIDKDGPGGCWIWTGRLDRSGYGLVDVGHKKLRAHRWSYEFHVGPIPDGLEIDHLCRVRHCVNPAHMEPVSKLENLARSTNPVRFALLHDTCQRGHPLTADNVYVPPARPNRRSCRTCIRDRARRNYAARKKEAATP